MELSCSADLSFRLFSVDDIRAFVKRVLEIPAAAAEKEL